MIVGALEGVSSDRAVRARRSETGVERKRQLFVDQAT